MAFLKQTIEQACPFCNGSAGMFRTRDRWGSTAYRVECRSCGGRGPVAATREEALKFWSRGW